MQKALYILAETAFEKIYGSREREDIDKRVNLYAPLQTPESIKKNPEILSEAEMIFSGWGGPEINENFLSYAPKLKMVFYGAGSIRHMVTDAFWKRNVRITSAYGVNAVPVAEYTLSQILFCLKCGWHFVRAVREDHNFDSRSRWKVPGGYESVVGLISLGMVGRRVCELLKPFDVKVLVYDPFVTEEVASAMNVTLCGLDEIFFSADVVSLHTPWLKETEGMITGWHFEMMKPFASFINTARGAVVCEDEMIEVLRDRPDLQAVLDITWPEPPEPNSPLYTLPNVALTPHIAGSMNNECRRMGRTMVEELDRYLENEPLQWEITSATASRLA